MLQSSSTQSLAVLKAEQYDNRQKVGCARNRSFLDRETSCSAASGQNRAPASFEGREHLKGLFGKYSLQELPSLEDPNPIRHRRRARLASITVTLGLRYSRRISPDQLKLSLTWAEFAPHLGSRRTRSHRAYRGSTSRQVIPLIG